MSINLESESLTTPLTYAKTIADFLDASRVRAINFYANATYLRAVTSTNLQPYTAEQFEQLMAAGAETVNEILSAIGGMPVVYEDANTGKTENGIVEACAGYSKENCSWEMVVSTPELRALHPGARLGVHFKPGELLESFYRATDNQRPFLRSALSPGRQLARTGSGISQPPGLFQPGI